MRMCCRDIVFLEFALDLLWAFFLFYIYIQYAYKKGWVVPNWLGDFLPTGSGVLYIFYNLPIRVSLVMVDMFGQKENGWYLVQSLMIDGVLALGVWIGWYDDVYGDRRIKSIRAHLHVLWTKGVLTSGIIKLITMPLIGALIGYIHRLNTVTVTGWDIVVPMAVSALLASVLTHVMNLLDVRPLRAVKGWLLLSFPLLLWVFLINGRRERWLDVWLFAAFLIAMSALEARRRLIIGDAGAILLGLWLTYMIVSELGTIVQLTIALIGIPIILYAEAFSLSRFIEKHPILRAIDAWGVLSR